MKKNAGFTLVELMIVVAIVGILSAIAIPSYQDYIIRGRIPDATSNLAGKRVQMEQFYQDNRTYVGATAVCPDTAISQYFDFTCTGQSTTAYTLTATGKSSMTGFVYTIDQSNAKATTAVPADWTTNATCWVTGKGGTC